MGSIMCTDGTAAVDTKNGTNKAGGAFFILKHVLQNKTEAKSKLYHLQFLYGSKY